MFINVAMLGKLPRLALLAPINGETPKSGEIIAPVTGVVRFPPLIEVARGEEDCSTIVLKDEINDEGSDALEEDEQEGEEEDMEETIIKVRIRQVRDKNYKITVD